MDIIRLRVNGKINLTLDVLGRRKDGYHDVEMIMQSIDLYDLLEIRKRENGLKISSNIEGLPLDEGNIVYRAFYLLKDRYPFKGGAEIKIHKNIPLEAGLAGGSADCAGALLGLNRLFKLNLNLDKLLALAKELGADVSFCLEGGTALASGIGEELRPLKLKEDFHLLIIKPDFGVSTRDIYGDLRVGEIRKRPDNKAMISYIEEGNIDGIASGLINVLEEVTLSKHPEIAQIKDMLILKSALGASMTGSGPSVYGIFRSREDALLAYNMIKINFNELYLQKTVSRGVEFC